MPGEQQEADGPPSEFREGDIDADFLQTPYGLLSLGAQALRAGHQVKVLNLSAFPWRRVQRVLQALRADLVGLSCFTANRRGVGLVAQELRRLHPSTRIVVGGPHATALASQMLEHHPEIDAVVLGEGEATFAELIARMNNGASFEGVAGAAIRCGGHVQQGAPRPRIEDLDTLAPPHDYFDTHLLLTARGCPGHCTFCAKNVVWGQKWHAHSVGYVLSAIERALSRLPVKMLMIKDDTFTADRERALGICRGLRERGLRLLWSCDTRADALDEELLREMRLSGCERLSIGVESGSPRVLKNIAKKMSPEQALAATGAARKFGLQVRWFMMLGNRGETLSSFRESLKLIERARPHEALFACLSVYPGTPDFQALRKAGRLDRELWFSEDFLELKMPFDASEQDTAALSEWFEHNKGVRRIERDGVQALREVLERLGDHAPAHLDLAGAYADAGDLDRAEQHAAQALALNHPAPGLARNELAFVAALRGDPDRAHDEIANALREDPMHLVLVHNAQAIRSWQQCGGGASGQRLELQPCREFQLYERTAQPVLPGPLPEHFERWD